MPNPRLTDLGCGLFCGLAMFVLAGLDRLLFGASTALYGVLFLLVSALTAVWVRRGDLASAPVVVPIAYAAGLPLLAEGEGGLGGHLMALVTALAMQAGWLYGGTLVAGVIVTVRKLRLMARRAAERERERGRERHGREDRGGRRCPSPGLVRPRAGRAAGAEAPGPAARLRLPGALTDAAAGGREPRPPVGARCPIGRLRARRRPSRPSPPASPRPRCPRCSAAGPGRSPP
ncbi:DUF6542 domain-containing protein [Streptomyces scabiei]|uniref:DUF6542 domain-containing protein n=1 Tax=Streptomyces scabiei TaxID=1930 RepID=UPI0038D4F318